jgi:hypothetical protein
VDDVGDDMLRISPENGETHHPTLFRLHSRTSSIGKSQSIKSSKLNLGNASDVEAHMAKQGSTTGKAADDGGHWGILSSFMSAAHHAASNIGSLTGSHDNIKSHPPDESNVDSDKNFGDQLDFLLADNGLKTAGQSVIDDDGASVVSRSNAHEIQFQPLRMTVLGTMGKGELSLEDFGVKEIVKHSKVPQIEVEDTNRSSKIISESELQPIEIKSSRPRHLTFDSSDPGLSNNRSGSLLRNKSDDQIKSLSRSLSPPLFRRSLSPNGIKRINSAQQKIFHRRSISSGHDILSLTLSNGDMSIASPPSFMPSIELKNITFAIPKRNNDFHQTFRKIPKSERLIDDYSCALQRDILTQGRIFISERHISFKSNILGWVTNIVIPIHEIVQLEKKTTAGLFPNGIVIQTLHQKYVFVSFLMRDTTFELITNIWNQLVRGSLGLDDGDVLLGLDNASNHGNDSDISTDDEYEPDSEESLMDQIDNDDDDDSDDVNMVHDDDEEDMDVPAGSISKHVPTEPEHEEISGQFKILEETISAPLPKVYQQLYGKDSSFFQSILSKQKNKNISPIPTFSKKNGIPTREYQYTKPLSAPVGPKETLCQVVETINHMDFQRYVLCSQTTKTPDVPSGNAFNVVTMLYLSWGVKNSTKITVYTYVNWTGKSWIKAAVDRGSIDGQKESIGILVDELRKKNGTTQSSNSEDNSFAGPSLPLIGPKTHTPSGFSPDIPSGETLLLEDTLHTPLGTLFSIIFDPSYLRNIIVAQKNFDISEISKFPEKGTKERQYTYTKPLNGPIGPKQTKCQITETVEVFDLNSHIHLVQSVSTPDIPSGGSFSVKTNFYLYWAENNSTRLVVSTYVNWTGKSWIKGTIEKGSIDGQKESISVLIKEVRNTLSSSGTTGKKRKRGKSIKVKKDDEFEEVFRKINAPAPSYRIGIPGLDMILGNGSGSFTILLIVAVLIWFLARKLLDTTPSPLEVSGVSKVVIGGQPYLIIPSVDQSLRNEKNKISSEYDIWDWINERTQGKVRDVQLGGEDLFYRSHKAQDLKEMAKVAEMSLERLRKAAEENDIL